MNIGNRVEVSFIMEVDGMKRDMRTGELILEGHTMKVDGESKCFISIPSMYAKLLESPNAS